MYRIYSALIEIVAAAVFIIPIWCIYNKLCFHSWKRTIIYMVFGFYFTAVLALVGFPNIASLKIDFAVNVIPFLDMVSDFINACLNILYIICVSVALIMFFLQPFISSLLWEMVL